MRGGKQILRLMGGLTMMVCAGAMAAPVVTPQKFAVYYSDEATAQELLPYQLLVLDADHHPPLAPLKEKGKLVLGYISTGEAEERMPYFAALKSKGILLNENPAWEGSHTIDLRDRAWPKMVLEEIIPALLHQGFDGVFLDTFDSPLHLEDQDPARWQGMKQASVDLIKAIRMHYPNITIMLNRGYPLLTSVSGDIDMVLGESVAGDYDFEKKIYVRVPNDLYTTQVRWLQEAKQRNPRLIVYTLDYARRDDSRTIAELYRAQRANGFYPYVATVSLDVLVPEPAAQ